MPSGVADTIYISRDLDVPEPHLNNPPATMSRPTVHAYHLPPTRLIPNSPYPLLHYPGLLSGAGACTPTSVRDLFASNDWETHWIFRYGATQRSHYHSRAHECMAVLSGRARIRFGVADTSEDMGENTHGAAHEAGGVTLAAEKGDVFLIPAGVSHKTYAATPEESFALLTPGDGHGIAGEDAREALERIELSGFTMMGAYPQGGDWDSCVGGEHEGRMEECWKVAKPGRDPVLGDAEEGVKGLWKEKEE